ncbi:MAG: hypothetical protein KDA51_05640, partial [Planctomycetales bacterium]|nr:hypothetical protein [Planctomycetales bacterium]
QPDVAAQQGIAAPVVTPHASEAVASGASQFHTADVADTPKEVPATLASDVPSTASQRESSDGDAGTIGQTVSRSNSSPKYSSDALQRWKSAVTSIDGMLADFASLAVSVEPIGSTQWNIVFPPGGQRPSEYCSQSERKAALQEAVQNSLGRPIRLTFSVMPGAPAEPAARAPQATVRIQQMREVAENPYVKRICEVLGGEILRVDTPQGQPSRPHFSSTAPDALRVGGGET